MDRILILSFQPQSGKTTLALQLSEIYRRQQRVVVLMDYSNDQKARRTLKREQAEVEGSSASLRGVAAGKEIHMLSKVWAEEVHDSDTVVVDTSSRLEQARLDYLMRQINSVLLVVDVTQCNLEEFGQQFGELIKRIRMARSRLVVVATHCDPDDLIKVVQLRQLLDLFQIPLVMKLEQEATQEQGEALAQMLLSEEMRVDSVSGNRLGRALHPATVRAGSMIGGIETLSEIVETVKREVMQSGEWDELDLPELETPSMEPLRETNERLARENERLKRS